MAGPIVKYDPIINLQYDFEPFAHHPWEGGRLEPANRFEKIDVELDFEHVEGDEEYLAKLARPATHYYVDNSKSIISTNDSPDVGFTHSINPFRGCLHGCCYCYARPTHEWLGMSAGLDFETKIMVKTAAAALLRGELSSPKYEPVAFAMSGVTDCYQPGEKRFEITRGCLKVLAEFRNPVGIVTKNHLVTRDVDLLADLARDNAAVVFISITSLDPTISMKMEPRASVPRRRLEAIRTLRAAGIPTGVLIAPVVPGLTDHEMPSILKAAVEAGAQCAGYTTLRLPYAVAGLFENWLSDHFPDRKDKVLNRIRSLRGGKLNNSDFGTRMRGRRPLVRSVQGDVQNGEEGIGSREQYAAALDSTLPSPKPEPDDALVRAGDLQITLVMFGIRLVFSQYPKRSTNMHDTHDLTHREKTLMRVLDANLNGRIAEASPMTITEYTTAALSLQTRGLARADVLTVPGASVTVERVWLTASGREVAAGLAS